MQEAPIVKSRNLNVFNSYTTYLKITFKLSDKVQVHHIKTYNLVYFLQQVGGFSNAIFTICKIAAFSLCDILFFRELINTLFFIRFKNEDLRKSLALNVKSQGKKKF
jgi:hypothetical protein